VLGGYTGAARIRSSAVTASARESQRLDPVLPQYRIALPNLVIEGRALSSERGSGVSVMVALAYLQAWDPDAVVAIYPPDHFASPSGPFTHRVEAAMSRAATRAWQVILLGSAPDDEPDLASAVVCARVSVLWTLARLAQPALMELLDSFVPLIDLEEEDEALELIFANAPSVDFASDILAPCPDHLLTMQFDDSVRLAQRLPRRQLGGAATPAPAPR
jgi:hypothetical protein